MDHHKKIGPTRKYKYLETDKVHYDLQLDVSEACNLTF
jgi:hypothetical protein